MKIERAQKEKQKLNLALAGPSGSGKTYSALVLAHSMAKRVCVIDTENGSAAMYSHKFPPYDLLKLEPPYTPQRYIEAIKLARKADYDCIIVDSLTHEWHGTGGCLDMVDNIHKTRPNTGWSVVKPLHRALIDYMVSFDRHLISTIRSDTHHDYVKNDKGKTVPIKVGLAPKQQKEIGYEFTLMFELDQQHNFTCSKDRTDLFKNNDIPEPLTASVGEKILDWLNDGKEPPTSEELAQEALKEEVLGKARTIYKEIKDSKPSKEEGRKQWEAFIKKCPPDTVDNELSMHAISLTNSLPSENVSQIGGNQ